jgi:hypothetical protein
MPGYEIQTVLTGGCRQDSCSPKLQEKPNCIKRILMVVHQENKAPDKFVLSVVRIHSVLSSPPGRILVALGRAIAKKMGPKSFHETNFRTEFFHA